MKKIAIIGAGFSGLILANHLAKVADVTLFEKSRGVGGRMSTRYADAYEFDHGAQFFTAHSPRFQVFIAKLSEAGVVARWDASFVEIAGGSIIHSRRWDAVHPHYVGVPRMNSIAKYLSQDRDIKLNTRITNLEKTKLGWQLYADNGEQYKTFDWVISTAPVAQTLALMPAEFSGMSQLQALTMQGCYALMLGFTVPLNLPWDVALVKQSAISWISVNSRKPLRNDNFALVILAANQWADEYLDAPDSWVKQQLLAEASQLTQQPLEQAEYNQLHRWRYANAPKIKLAEPLIDSDRQLAVCGDWYIGGRVESAFLAASRLVEELQTKL